MKVKDFIFGYFYGILYSIIYTIIPPTSGIIFLFLMPFLNWKLRIWFIFVVEIVYISYIIVIDRLYPFNSIEIDMVLEEMIDDLIEGRIKSKEEEEVRKTYISIERVIYGILIIAVSNVIMFFNSDVMELFGLRMRFETIFTIEVIAGLLFGAFSVFTSILVEIIYNGLWMNFIYKDVKKNTSSKGNDK